MSKKAFFLYCLCVGLLVAAVIVKQKSITQKNQKQPVSFYRAWKENGKSVVVRKAEKSDLESFWKMALQFNDDNTYTTYVPKAILDHLSINQQVALSSKDKKATGKITFVSSEINRDTGMYLVKISADAMNGNKDEKYLGKVVVSGIKDVVIVPFDVVQTEKNQHFVWVAKEGKAHRQTVILKDHNNKGIVVENINEKDLIIISGLSNLKENDQLKINCGK